MDAFVYLRVGRGNVKAGPVPLAPLADTIAGVEEVSGRDDRG